MFLAGLKFALGFAVGMTLLTVSVTLGVIAGERLGRWRTKRCRLQWEAKARVRQRPALRFREGAVFCFHFRTNDWRLETDKSKYLR